MQRIDFASVISRLGGNFCMLGALSFLATTILGCSVGTLTKDSCAPGQPCDDHNECTSGDTCVAGSCTGTPVVCNDDNPCTDDACDPLLGCTFSDNTRPCDNGDPCTDQDRCEMGQCRPGEEICNCLSTADCAAFEDGNLCNGVLFCNTQRKCQVDPATSVVCDPTQDTPCRYNSCEPASGLCHLLDRPEGFACDDGLECTEGDGCQQGICSGNDNCDDDNPCTDDACDALTGLCRFTHNTSACDDGDACTVNDNCDQGRCEGAPEVCDDGNACTDDGCDSLLGCTNTDNTEACDDGDPCTQGDVCEGGACRPGPAGSDCTPCEGWPDAAQGLCWEDPPLGGLMSWSEAPGYCSGLGDGWRVPKIQELMLLIRGCDQGICPVHDPDCLSWSICWDNCGVCEVMQGPANGCYWDSGLGGACDGFYFWSSSQLSDNTSLGWMVSFEIGHVHYYDKRVPNFVRCVRTMF